MKTKQPVIREKFWCKCGLKPQIGYIYRHLDFRGNKNCIPIYQKNLTEMKNYEYIT